MPIFDQNIPDPRIVDKPRPQFETFSPLSDLIEVGGELGTDVYKGTILGEVESDLTELETDTLATINGKTR